MIRIAATKPGPPGELAARRSRCAWRSLALVLVSTVSAPAGTVYIHPSSAWQISSWRYFKGTQEPPVNWRERDFDDSGWSSGKAPFGRGLRGFIRYGTVLDDMPGGYSTLFLRRHFYVDDVARTRALKLSANASDGFVAWLNVKRIEEIASGDNHRIHRIMFDEVQRARYARVLLRGTNPHVKQYGGRFTPTEFMIIAAPPAAPSITQ